ncbi:cytochrome c oxidase subunit IVB [Bacillus solimangrovi]|uniref:Cytochrome c oxidase subunit IVB n=1 Tax=Bacillus solimangrovi TaxID=1305675 RepID=A0A1E5LIL3_9BACI|nr:cytochrome c oxidase subunit IVB [Bacillus solimangrovi]OEH93917.1 cytochrome c oxidase subunit IVB [Bacillus solimangrovi]
MTNQANSSQGLEFRKQRNKDEMKQQVVVFSLMIFFTLIAFAAVAFEAITPIFTAPFILILAVVQVLFQLYYFMHMSHKGHEVPIIFIFGGVFTAIIMVAALCTIVWW